MTEQAKLVEDIMAQAILHAQQYDTPSQTDARRRYTHAQMETAVRRGILAALTPAPKVDVVESEGVRRIAEERKRQVEVEGWTPEHDATHVCGTMAMAAAAYAYYQPDIPATALLAIPLWPWHEDWWKPEVDKVLDQTGDDYTKARIRDLERAGALIAAEIDRLTSIKESSDVE